MIKKHIAHRFISILTALAISFSGLILFDSFKAYASNYTSKEYYDEALLEELRAIEPVKENYGLKGVDFCNLYTSDRIPVYEYKKDGIVETGHVLPVYYQNKMKLIMFEVENNRYQAIAVPKGVSVDSDSLALIYDDSGCNIYNGQSTVQLFHSNIIIEGRNHITALSSNDEKQIELACLTKKYKIHYYVEPLRLQTYYILNVNYVPQTNNNICWAASTAMIVNYKKNTNYSAWYVAFMRYGSNYNQGLSPSGVADNMNSTFNLGYTYHNSAASQNVICSNINNHNPIYGSFSFLNGNHGAVIYGYNIINNTFFIMDPEYGSTTGYMSSTVLKYTSPASGYLMSLDRTVSKKW